MSRAVATAALLALAFAGETSAILAQAPRQPLPIPLVRVAAPGPGTPAIISPASVTLASGGQQRFSATVAGVPASNVTWSSTGGTIASDGTFVAGPTSGLYLVKASLATGATSGSAMVVIGGLAPTVHYLSDRPWTAATNGLGPVERDRSNGGVADGDGRTLTLRGVPFAKGVGVSAPSTVRYALSGKCTTFAGQVGLDDEVGVLGSAAFEIWLDGVKRYDSGVMNGVTAAKGFSINVVGVTELALVLTDGGDTTNGDHGDWADARVSCAGDAAPPSIAATSPLSNASAVALTTNVTATFSEPMNAATLTSSTMTLVPQGSSTPVAATLVYSIATNIITLDPAVDLTGSTVYTATLKGGSAGAKDLANNPLATDRAWTFTTAPPPDTLAPTVTTVSPASGGTGVPLTANPAAWFSEAISPTTLTSATVTLVAQGSSTPIAAAVTYTSGTNSVTLDPVADLTPGTLYTATIKGGGTGVKDLAGNPLATDKVWTFTTASASSYLSDRTWISALNGYGPVERDRANGEDLANDGSTLTLNGLSYAKGFGVHAASDIRFALSSACTLFTATVGVDDEVGANGSVVFQVWTNGVKQYDSGLMTGATASKSVSVSLSGVTDLGLVVADGGDNSDYDHGDWADAQVSCAPDLTPPTVTATTPGAGATGVTLNATLTATFSEAMTIATLTTASATLTPVGGGSPVAATVTYLDATRTLTLRPVANLLANNGYTATLKSGAAGVKDLAGNPLSSDKVWTFTTGATTAATGIPISPGQDIQAIVNAAAPAATFLLKTGVHRLQTIRPRDGDTFTGEAGAVLSGARLLTTFTRSGTYWLASGQTQQGAQHGACLAGYPRCDHPEQLFLDDQALLHVATLAEVVSGTWYFDYAGDRIYLADDPTGKRVETSVTPTAFEPTGKNVTITGLTIEKYANSAQQGVVSADGTTGWVISSNDVRWNHGLGIRVGTSARVLNNKAHHNGQLGIGGGGSDVLVEGNEISYNNLARFDPGWEAGGTKFALTDRLTVRGNFVHHNFGPGLWTDIDNINTLYENNTVEDNEQMGIFHEISYAAIIRNNVVRRNGLGFATWIWGAGILVAASPNVEVYGNTLEGNADGIGAVQQVRGSGAFGPHEISNLYVHDNIVSMTQGWTGFVQDVGDTSYFTARNNRFERNRYQLGSDATYFTWMNSVWNEAQWKNLGQDLLGVFAR